jgi:pimeloyl-ACP methyl ester carboxylesterase
MNYRPEITEAAARTGTLEVEGLNIFLREAGTPGSLKLVLLHGFPVSSHQYRH